MENQEAFIKQLDERLQALKYSQDEKHGMPNVWYVSYVNNPPPLKVRNLCAVMEPPEDIVDLKTIKRYFEFIRKSLLDKYGEAFFWKELEISFIVLCEHSLYEVIAENEGKVINEVSFALSSIIGTCFIDKDNSNHFSKHTFGLFFSGEHFKTINALVEEFCSKQQK